MKRKKYSWYVIFVANPGERPENTEKFKKEMFITQLYAKTDAETETNVHYDKEK